MIQTPGHINFCLNSISKKVYKIGFKMMEYGQMLRHLIPPFFQKVKVHLAILGEKNKVGSEDVIGLYHKTYYGRSNLRVSVIS